MTFYHWFLRFLAAWVIFTGSVHAQGQEADAPKQLWQLLDYVAVDYSGAVQNGVVVSEAEYAEMQDFVENANKLLTLLPTHKAKGRIAEAINQLRVAVTNKASDSEITRLAHQANSVLLSAYPIPIAPKSVPDLSRGKSLYAVQCVSCHGATGNGDGPLAATLDPEPIAFTDADRAKSRSLMALYQVISQGVNGTSMPSFATLPEEDRWALAFFIGTLSHNEDMQKQGKILWDNNEGNIKQRFTGLDKLSTLTEASLTETLPADTVRNVVAYLRTHPDLVEKNRAKGLALSRLKLAQSLEAKRSGDVPLSTQLALSAYLDGFEPIEPMLSARNKELLVSVEKAMLDYRSAVTKGTVEQAQNAAENLEALLTRVDLIMQDSKADPTATFIGAATILLREGVEALLIVIGMITFLKKTERPDLLQHVHRGWISALLAGLLTWVVATYLIGISGSSREVTEGIGSVLASVVLLSVGLWMHQKSSAGKWQEYLKGQLSKAISSKSVWALFALSFVAVYREVFETVLFYSALMADGNNTALAGGFITAVLLLALIAWVMLYTSARMNLGRFFSFTSVLVVILAVVLIGKGMSALQEAGWIGVNVLTAIPRIEWLGVYPTTETMTAQILVGLIALAGFGAFSRKPHK
jgi:high-affinity iron transporter